MPSVDRGEAQGARIQDYLLGGHHNFAVDRSEGDRLVAASPRILEAVRGNRAFSGRAVRWCATRGIDQFLELGSGLPTIGSVHEIARRHRPEARVAYVDVDDIAVAHTRDMIAKEPLLSVTAADVADPATVLAAPGVADLLDLGRPLAVLATSVWHFIEGTDRLRAVAAHYRDALVPGSVLVVSHVRGTGTPEGGEVAPLESIRESYARHDVTIVMRTVEEIGSLFAGFDVVPPGIVDLAEWPDRPVDPPRARAWFWGGVGVLPTPGDRAGR